MTVLPAQALCADPQNPGKALRCRRDAGSRSVVGISLFGVVVVDGCGAGTASSLAEVRVFLTLETKSNNNMDQSHY